MPQGRQRGIESQQPAELGIQNGRGLCLGHGISLRSFFFSSRRRHTRCSRDWSSDVCSSDLALAGVAQTNAWAFSVANIQVIPSAYALASGLGANRGFAIHVAKATNSADLA